MIDIKYAEKECSGFFYKAYYYVDSLKYLTHEESDFIFEAGECFHHETLPALLAYHHFNDYILNTESYYINGRLHRLNAPARIHYMNNKVHLEEYFEHGFAHHIHDASDIYYDDNGNVNNKNYYLKGCLLSFEEWGQQRPKYFNLEVFL